MNRTLLTGLVAAILGLLLVAGCSTEAEPTTAEPQDTTVVPQVVINDEPAEEPQQLTYDVIEVHLDGPSPTYRSSTAPVMVEFYNRDKSTLEDEGTSVELDIPSVGFSDVLRFGEHVNVYLPEGEHTFYVLERDSKQDSTMGEFSGLIIVG